MEYAAEQRGCEDKNRIRCDGWRLRTGRAGQGRSGCRERTVGYSGAPGRTGGCRSGRTGKVYVPRRSDSGGTCRRGDRDCRAAGECNPQEEAVIHCHWNEYGKAEGSRRICVSGKFRCDLSRRTGDCRPYQRH